MASIIRHSPVADTPAAACACGWVSTSMSSTGEDRKDEWMTHYSKSLDPIALRTMVARRAIIELSKAFEELNHFHWQSSDAKVIALAWGWWVQVNRHADALVILFNTGHSVEATAVFRACFEHALYLHALLSHGESAVGAAVVTHENNMRNLIDTMRKAHYADLLSDLPAATDKRTQNPDSAWTQKIYSICEHYNATGTLYALYRVVCGIVHPTLKSSELYVNLKEELGSPSFFRRSADFGIETDLIFWTAVMLILSAKAFNTLLVQPELGALAGSLSRELGAVGIDNLDDPELGSVYLSKDRLDSLLFAPDGSLNF